MSDDLNLPGRECTMFFFFIIVTAVGITMLDCSECLFESSYSTAEQINCAIILAD